MPFRAVPFRDRLLNRLIKKAEPLAIDRGEPVFRAGEQARDVILVREGLLHLERGAGDSESRVVDLVLPWEVAGVDAILQEGAYRWSAVAGSRSLVQRLDGRGVRRVLKRAEGTFDALWEASLARLALAREMGPGGRGTTARYRLAAVLVHLALRAEGRTPGSGEAAGATGPLELPLDLSHRILGELAGLHRSTVTTALNDWIYEDLLEAAGRGWRIPDPPGLLAASSR